MSNIDKTKIILIAIKYKNIIIKRYKNMNYTEVQSKVNEMIIKLGGYWSDATAALRINEELAELLTAIEEEKEIEKEIADLMIVSLTLANKHQIKINQKLKPTTKFDYLSWIIEINKKIGDLSRYISSSREKKPKKQEAAINLQNNMNKICLLIQTIGNAYNCDIEKAVADKVKFNINRDKDRFNN